MAILIGLNPIQCRHLLHSHIFMKREEAHFCCYRNLIFQNMTSFLSYILLFLLNKFAHAEYNGHFFKTTADGLHEIKEQPIITYNIFDCSRQKSCATVVPNVKPNEEDDKFISTDVALKKVYGLFRFIEYYPQ